MTNFVSTASRPLQIVETGGVHYHPTRLKSATADRSASRLKKILIQPKEILAALVYTSAKGNAGTELSAELLQRACGGDRNAFGALVEAHYDFIHSVAWRWCGTQADAEDIAQEVCIRLGKSIRTFKGQSAFRTWLYTMTLNVVRDHQRKSARRRRDEDRIANDPIFFSHQSAEEDERGEWLWAAVRRLPDKQRDAVLLVHSEGMSHAAAAQILDCSENTVSWHLHEARKRLKDLLKKEAV